MSAQVLFISLSLPPRLPLLPPLQPTLPHCLADDPLQNKAATLVTPGRSWPAAFQNGAQRRVTPGSGFPFAPFDERFSQN